MTEIHMGSHNVTYAGTLFTYPGGMEG